MKQIVIPAEAQRRAGTAEIEEMQGPATEPGQSQNAAGCTSPSPGSTHAGRPGGLGSIDIRPGSALRFGRDDKAAVSGKVKA